MKRILIGLCCIFSFASFDVSVFGAIKKEDILIQEKEITTETMEEIITKKEQRRKRRKRKKKRRRKKIIKAIFSTCVAVLEFVGKNKVIVNLLEKIPNVALQLGGSLNVRSSAEPMEIDSATIHNYIELMQAVSAVFENQKDDTITNGFLNDFSQRTSSKDQEIFMREFLLHGNGEQCLVSILAALLRYLSVEVQKTVCIDCKDEMV